ncbi:DUF7146 domain-containing protein [Novosphingobium aerophilum]|uniref:Toprim domain-containing protein n=1 Tax=Novosphingobium aerophilum TaxID=2839843 RepID=A0A7X1FBM6_9SPHN|nr:toprim domain-containing protein [Novosphingobium aerophilum]MBC2653564.1 toprim domain-containing protein [Novosphingobium aerophilum]
MTLIRNPPTPELRELVRRLEGTWHAETAMCRCPAHADRTPSLSIRQGDRSILVTCHAGCDSRDVLRALARIAEIPRSSSEHVHRPRLRVSTAHLRIWREGQAIESTLAERYVRDVRRIRGELEDLRYHPRCPRGQGQSALFEPALIVGMRKAGEVAAIQRIFLDPLTARYTEKRVLGHALGAAWTNGAPRRVIGLCEGFETAAAYTSLTGIKAWATMGARRFHQAEIPVGVETLILLPDNDPEGQRARHRAAEVYARPGLTIETERPPRGLNDWADVLKR